MLKIKLLGIGSDRYDNLKKDTLASVEEMGLSYQLEEVNSIDDILHYNIKSIPALWVNGLNAPRIFEHQDWENFIKYLNIMKKDILFHKKILVATDFSSAATNALEYAANLANYINGDLYVLHAYTIRNKAGSLASVRNVVRNDAERQIREEKERLEKQFGSKLRVLTKVVERDTAKSITSMAENLNADVIIMGTKGAGALKEFFVGSTAVEVAEKATRPLLLIPAKSTFQGIEKIGAALEDVSAKELAALNELPQLAIKLNAKLEAFHLYPSDLPETVKPTEVTIDDMTFPLNYEPIEGDLFSNMNNYVANQHYNWVCFLRKERNIFQELFHVSLTKQEIFRSDRPILILPPVAVTKTA